MALAQDAANGAERAIVAARNAADEETNHVLFERSQETAKTAASAAAAASNAASLAEALERKRQKKRAYKEAARRNGDDRDRAQAALSNVQKLYDGEVNLAKQIAVATEEANKLRARVRELEAALKQAMRDYKALAADLQGERERGAEAERTAEQTQLECENLASALNAARGERIHWEHEAESAKKMAEEYLARIPPAGKPWEPAIPLDRRLAGWGGGGPVPVAVREQMPDLGPMPVLDRRLEGRARVVEVPPRPPNANANANANADAAETTTTTADEDAEGGGGDAPGPRAAGGRRTLVEINPPSDFVRPAGMSTDEEERLRALHERDRDYSKRHLDNRYGRQMWDEYR